MLFQNTQNQILNDEEIILLGNKIEKVDHFKFFAYQEIVILAWWTILIHNCIISHINDY